MNIFVLHNDSIISAKMLCNKHVVKMILESTQMLCNCFDSDVSPYKRTHYNHPCSIWVRESLENYNWLKAHAYALCNEYTKRYGKIHKCQNILDSLPKPKIKSKRLTEFIKALPDKYKNDKVEIAYQNYYLNEKLHFCKWMNENDIPEFVKFYIEQNNLNIQDYIK